MNFTLQNTLFRRARRGTLLAATLTSLAVALPAQWSSNAKKNTFVDPDCQLQPAGLAGILALDPVLVPCDDGCFYAWVDSNGAIKIQVIDDCGYQALSTPHVVAQTGNHMISPVIGLFLPSQLAGCQYLATNQLFLAYTVWNGTNEQLKGDVFTFAGGTLTPTGAVVLQTSLYPHGILTPVADSGRVSGSPDGAVWGCRDWDPLLGNTDMFAGNIKTAALTPRFVTSVDMFVLPFGTYPPPRLSVVNDNAGGTYAGWRGWDGTGWYHEGTRLDTAAAVIPPWPTPMVPTSRTIDDWVLAADRLGGVFVAQTDGTGTTMMIGHVTAARVWSNFLAWDNVSNTESIHALAMVGIDAPTGSTAITSRAALTYRAHTSIKHLELTDNGATTLAPGLTAVLGPVMDPSPVRGSSVASHRGVAVAWTEDTGPNPPPGLLFGQEVDLSWNKLWNNGNPLIVSRNDLAQEEKFIPMVVRKHTLPEVIFGWVDTRTNLEASGHGAYVQSVADDYVQFLGMGIKKSNGKLGSSILCALPKEHFDIHGFTLVITDPFDPFGDIGQELFVLNRTDGTLELLRDINAGPAGSNPSRSEALGSRRIFAATTQAGGREPWVTDGTSGGTLQLADCAPGAGSSAPWLLGCGQDGVKCYFSSTTTGTGRELWCTDGTPAGTAMVADLLPGPGNGVVSGNHATAGGFSFFWGNDGVHGIELMRTDGTAAGTIVAVDLTPGSGSTSPGGIAVLGGAIVFGAGANGLGSEPYVLDPSTGPVALLGDLAPGAASSGPSFLTTAAGAVWFSASNAAGRELWRTDGTPAGTIRVADINPTGSSNPSIFTDAGSYVLFTANDGAQGEELWRTDGTAAGTTLVADILPGAGSSNPTAITSIGGGRFVFTAAGSGTDREPWVTDGTGPGTLRLADVNPGAAGSNPQAYDVVNGTMFFDAVVAGHARTVQLELSAPATFGQGCGGSFGIPRIGATSNAVLGTTLNVTLAGAAPNSFAGLIFGATSQVASLGSCTLYVGLPELGILLAPTDGAGNAVVSLPVPNNPALLDATFFFQWAVLDATGPLLGLSLSNALRVVVE